MATFPDIDYHSQCSGDCFQKKKQLIRLTNSSDTIVFMFLNKSYFPEHMRNQAAGVAVLQNAAWRYQPQTRQLVH